ncbi:MAG: trypsin-like peptidase domain-containing protein, partial [Nitrospinota bacterium]
MKPAAGLVIAEVSAEVTVNCGGRKIRTTPPAIRETGTGWLIDPKGLLITNAHVVQPAHSPGPWVVRRFASRAALLACVPILLEQIAPGDRARAEERVKRRVRETVVPAAKVKLLPEIFVMLSNGARLPAEVKKYSPPLTLEPGQVSGRDLALLKIKGEDYPVLPLADSRAVKIGDPVYILGFPGVVLSHELLNQSTRVEASVTNGAVSGFKQDRTDQPVIQTDAPAAWGNSGGPAVNARGEVVGVLTFVSLAPGPEGAIVQGFNFLIPSNTVREFIQGTAVRFGAESGFNMAWWAGLRDFFNGRFTRAERRFEAANALVGNVPDVRRMLAEAQDKIKHPPPRPFPWAWVALGVTLASGGGFGGIWLCRWWGNRHRISPSQIVRLMEKGDEPLILDVRKPEAYEASPLRVPRSTFVSPEELESGSVTLSVERSRTVVAYCSEPDEAASARAARQVRRLGFADVKILKGGIGAWTNAGLPVEAKSYLPSIGLEIYRNLSVGDLQRRQFAAGQVIFDEGADAKGEAFVVHSGTV